MKIYIIISSLVSFSKIITKSESWYHIEYFIICETDFSLTCPNPRRKASNNCTACQVGRLLCLKYSFKIAKSPTKGTHVFLCQN